MAAPTNTPFSSKAPSGIKLKDGSIRSVIVFNRLPSFSVWEKTVKPLGYDGGPAVDQTTQLNLTWKTKRPQTLIDTTDMTATGAYDPVLNSTAQIQALLNREGSVSQYFPDGSGIDAYAYLQKLEFAPLEFGKQPEVTITVVVTNYDPVNNVEQGPVENDVPNT
jgi:hypothetical protein